MELRLSSRRVTQCGRVSRLLRVWVLITFRFGPPI